MFRNLPFSSKAFFIVAFAATALTADTIVLKTGERLEAKIVKATDITVEAEVRVSSSITDLQTFQKADIANIEKPDPAETAFAELQSVALAANSLTLYKYDSTIQSQLKPFVTKYPNSPRVSQVQEIIVALEAEKKRVALGEVKIDSIWFTPAELEKEKYQISATILLQQMKSVGQAGDSTGALNLFSQLEKDYPGARAYPAAVDYAVQLIPNVQKEINTKKTIFANDMSERQKGLEILPDFKKAPLIAAAAGEEAQAIAALESAIKSGIKWTPIYPRNQRSIEELQKTVTAEASRLAAIKTAPMHASIAAAMTGKKQLAAGNLEAATLTLQNATTLWGTNEMLKTVSAELATAKLAPSPTPTPADGAAPVIDTTVAPSGAAVPVVSPAPNAKPASTPVKSVTPKGPTTASTPITPATQPLPVAEEKVPFFATIPGAIAILVVVALIAGAISVGMKAKGKKNSSSEI